MLNLLSLFYELLFMKKRFIIIPRNNVHTKFLIIIIA